MDPKHEGNKRTRASFPKSKVPLSEEPTHERDAALQSEVSKKGTKRDIE